MHLGHDRHRFKGKSRFGDVDLSYYDAGLLLDYLPSDLFHRRSGVV